SIPSAPSPGDPQTPEQLLPLVYDELRKLAAQKLSHEAPGQTLDATALVHEAYLRLVSTDKVQQWNNHGHFVAHAAEGMRRIPVETARRKQAAKHGGRRRRIELSEVELPAPAQPDELLLLDEALAGLAREDPSAAELAKLHLFAGLTIEQAGEA